MVFNYSEAFSRNLGLVTEVEQLILQSKKVAIAGMGGVGGSHLQTLVRMGIQNFHIADMDCFELVNFNRQAGASLNTLGQPKAAVMREQALRINPDCNITLFPNGVTEKNIDAFLDGVDVYVDGLDFFVLDIRARVFRRCHERGIPAITAGPVGASVALLVFGPGRISFEDYFQMGTKDPLTQATYFLVGLTPRLPQKDHFVDLSRVNFQEKRGSSLAPACMACSAIIGMEVLKILLGRGKTYYVPWALQFDMYQNRFHKLYNWLGNKHLINKLKIQFVLRKVSGNRIENNFPEKQYTSDIEQILDLARWAPSGDNSQPWFLSIDSDDRFRLDLSRFKKNVYNLLPMPDLISTGMFLENAAIAARQKNLRLNYNVQEASVDASLTAGADDKKSLLYPYIKKRSVNRFAYHTKRLQDAVKQKSEGTLDDDLQIIWLESFSERARIAKILMSTTDISLRLSEGYKIHRDMIDWSGKDSKDKMPYGSLGASRISSVLMKWALATEKRNRFMLKMPASTLSFQIELSMIPALMCAGHFIIAFDPQKTPNPQAADYIRAGQSVQRFWLYLTSQNLALQPWYLPVMFSRYIEENISFAADKALNEKTKKMHNDLTRKILVPLDIQLGQIVFTGRVGEPLKKNIRRSIRKDLADLINQ